MPGGHVRRDRLRRQRRWNREHEPRRQAAITREREKRRARGDYRPENRAAYKSWLRENADEILAEERARIAALGGPRVVPVSESERAVAHSRRIRGREVTDQERELEATEAAL